MNPPSPAPTPGPTPEKAAAEALKLKLARALEQKRNREISHMLKGGSFQAHQPPRSMPHVRGR